MNTTRHPFRTAAVCSGLLTAALVLSTGCKKAEAPPDDNTLASNVHNALSADASIAREPIQSTAANGVVTLNGTVTNETARMVAAEDAAKVAGVREVVNNLAVPGALVEPTITTPATVGNPGASPSARPVTRTATREEREAIRRHVTPPAPAAPYNNPPAQTTAPAPAPVQTTQAPPPRPPAPVYRDLHIPAGTIIPVRMTQTLDSGTTQPDTRFTGALAAPITVDGEVALPAGSPVSGRVVNVHDAGHFSGNSMLSVELTSISRRGEHFNVATEAYTVEGKGRGKNTAEKIGGGAAVGAVLGGIFGGGKGAAIGAAAGGATGAGANAITRGQQVQITSETVVRFRLSNGFTVRTGGKSESYEETNPNPTPGLQPRY